jgi:hypothetical protein
MQSAKALEETDTDTIMQLVDWVLIHCYGALDHHYPLAAIREHV